MLLDTSGFFALLDVADTRHAAARMALQRDRKPFTHSYVLAELIPLAETRSLPRPKVLRFVSSLLLSAKYEIVWVDKNLHERAHQLFLARPDKAYSLCDAVSFVLMRERKELEALTTDHHFAQEGFIRRLLP